MVRYLETTQELELTYGSMDNAVVGYTDTDHTSQHHWHSISGYTFLIGGGAVTWGSKKQPVIALSTMEAEYIVVAHTMKEALWLWAFIGKLTMTLVAPTMVHCNNQATIALSKNGQHHTWTKHIDIRFHFICKAVTCKSISLIYCHTGSMMADLLTKPFNCTKTAEHTSGLGLLPA